MNKASSHKLTDAIHITTLITSKSTINATINCHIISHLPDLILQEIETAKEISARWRLFC